MINWLKLGGEKLAMNGMCLVWSYGHALDSALALLQKKWGAEDVPCPLADAWCFITSERDSMSENQFVKSRSVHK